jgi:hypothetical protein
MPVLVASETLDPTAASARTAAAPPSAATTPRFTVARHSLRAVSLARPFGWLSRNIYA